MTFSSRKRQYDYINQYQKDNYDRVSVMIPKGRKAEWMTAAKQRGKTLSAFVADCVAKEMERAED